MKHTFVFTILLIGSVLSASGQVEAPKWRHVASFPDAPGGRYDDMAFLDENRGWVVNLSGEIWHTTNGGESWVKQLDARNAPFRSIAMRPHPNSQGLAVGWAGTVFNPTSVLWETHDGGDHWIDISHRIMGLSPEGICGMYAVGQSAWGVGAFHGAPTIISTHNGGILWEGQDVSHSAGALVDVYFQNEMTGFAVGGSGSNLDGEAVVLRTVDGGATWNKVFQSTRRDGLAGEWAWKISFPTEMVGYVSVEYAGNSNNQEAKVLKTEDGGITWRELWINGSRSSAGLQGIGFISENVGWASGRSITSLTQDGGETWQQLQHFNPITKEGQMDGRMNRFYVVNDALAFGVGRRLYKIAGYGAITIDTEAAQRPESFALEASYPNPFTESTTLNYTLRTPSEVRVRVIDVLGRMHRTFYAGYQEAGAHQFEWNGMDDAGNKLASGSYILLIDIGDSVETKQVVLLR